MGRGCNWDLCVFLAMPMTGRQIGVQAQKKLPHSLKQWGGGNLRGGSEQLVPRGVQAEMLPRMSLAVW